MVDAEEEVHLSMVVFTFHFSSMANLDHEAMLNKCMDAWNAWRASDSDIEPNLAGIRLSRFNLREINSRDQI